eukprot:jgi/Picre1/32106/NNA_007454.t1
MTDSTRKSEAERCLEMLMKASKNTKRNSFIDLSRKRGRPKKKNTGAVTEVVDLTNSSNSIVENQDANEKNNSGTRKKKYIKWTTEDKRLLLEKYQSFKDKGRKNPLAATVRYFGRHRVSMSGVEYPSYYQNLNESNLRGWIKRKDDIGCRRAGRPPVLKPETVKACEAFVLSRFENIGVTNDTSGMTNNVNNKTGTSDAMSSRTLKPLIQDVIRRMGEGDKLDDKTFTVSTTWVNKLCRRIGIRMRCRTKGAIKEHNDENKTLQ